MPEKDERQERGEFWVGPDKRIYLEETEFIKLLKEEAARFGYSDLREYLANRITNFDSELFLANLYSVFLEDVQNGDIDPITEKKWTIESTYEDFLRSVERMIEFRLEQIKAEKKKLPPSFVNLASEIEKLEKESKNVEIEIKGIGEAPPILIYEAYEELLRRCKEAIERYKRGEIRIPEPPNWTFTYGWKPAPRLETPPQPAKPTPPKEKKEE